MATASIPVDLLNPGQVFACLGFLEAADQLCGNARGGFDWSSRRETRFHLGADGDANPFSVVLEFLAGASISTVTPQGSGFDTISWGVPTDELPAGDSFPFALPNSFATLPAILKNKSRGGSLLIEHWGDSTRRDNVKFWAGAQGKPGAAFALDALTLVRDQLSSAHQDPFSLSSIQSGGLRFDWRKDYVPIHLGFSLNAHQGKIVSRSYPLVDLMAAIGLTNARPAKAERTKLEYRYSVIGTYSHDAPESVYFDPIFLRAALGCASLPFPTRTFRIILATPGKDDRCITGISEETAR